MTTGCLSACCVPDLPILGEVDKNNIQKFGHRFSLRDNVKFIKPTNHESHIYTKNTEYLKILMPWKHNHLCEAKIRFERRGPK